MTVDVSIVGCGPVGATLANLLADYGYTIAILEKELEVYHSPRAIHIDDEVVRIFQAVGIFEEIKDSITPFEKMQFVGANRKVLLETGMPTGYQPHGYAPSNWFFQPTLEKALRAHFQKKSNIHWLKGYLVTSITNNANETTLVAETIQDQVPITIQSKYLIGCDGGKSLVRTTMNVGLENLQFDQPWVVVDTFVKEEKDLELLPSLHQQICDPYRPITYVPAVGKHRRFEFMLRSDEQPAQVNQPSYLNKLIEPFIDPAKLNIIRSAVYTFHGLIANQWQKGRLLLAGDSAHQMPPFAGQGMCSGIRDAHNLAFKLDLVLSGKANNQLLDSYQAERQPHVTEISKGAIKLGKTIQTQSTIKARLRDFQFFLARNFSFIQEKMRQDFVKKTPYQSGFLGGNSPLSGQLIIQPSIQLSNGQTCLLDEILGNRLSIISLFDLPKKLEYFQGKLNGQVFQLGLHFKSTILESWMKEQQMEFVLVRPDRYIFDGGKIKDLDKILKKLIELLG